jgi:hypothetical protein
MRPLADRKGRFRGKRKGAISGGSAASRKQMDRIASLDGPAAIRNRLCAAKCCFEAE